MAAGLALNQDSKLMGIIPRIVITAPLGIPMPSIDIVSNKRGFSGSLNVFIDGKPTLTGLAAVIADPFPLPFTGSAGNIPPVPVGIMTATGSPGMMPNVYKSSVSFWSVNGGSVMSTGLGNFQDMASCPNAMALGMSSVFVKE